MQPIYYYFFPSKSVRQSRACSPDTLWRCYTLSSGQYGQGHMAQGHFNVAQTIDSEGKQATCWCVVFEQLDGSRLLIMGDNDLHSITIRNQPPPSSPLLTGGVRNRDSVLSDTDSNNNKKRTATSGRRKCAITRYVRDSDCRGPRRPVAPARAFRV